MADVNACANPHGVRPDRSVKRNLRRLWLTLVVHIDAFLFDPATFARAAWWRMFGLRVRSRSLIEPLIGLSTRAYALWQLENEPEYAGLKLARRPVSQPLVVAIDLSDGRAGLQATMESIQQSGSDVHIVFVELADEIRIGEIETPFWLCTIRPGDRLAANAIQEYRMVIEQSHKTIIYADDDLCSEQGKRSSPHFKPEWNPELFRWHDYLTNACMLRIDDLEELRRFSKHPGWHEQLIARRVHERGDCAMRLPLVLHHRRNRPAPGLPSTTEPDSRTLDRPSVTVIVPTRNRAELLRACMSGLSQTRYDPFDTIVIDNGTNDPDALAYLAEISAPDCRILPFPGAFNFAAMNNCAALEAQGEYLCFLNNDIEMLEGEWLGRLVSQACRPDVGAVGARLLYPDGLIQHAGVVTGVGGGAAHAHRNLRPEEEGYFCRHSLPQFVSAVTGACLVVRRDRFLAVGGFDEERFPVAFNDVDLCLKLNARGWQTFYEPRATLIHHESKSRGKDRDRVNRARFAKELEALKARWKTDSQIDPYHSPALSQFSEKFVVRL